MYIYNLFLCLTATLTLGSTARCSAKYPEKTLPQSTKKERFIGSAWQQAIQHVYIASSDVTTQPRPTEKPKETPPQTPIQQRPEPIPEQAPTPEQPSPEEMEMFLANLQHVLTSLEEDDTVDEAYIYYDDASDDSDVPMNFNEFMHALHGNNY